MGADGRGLRIFRAGMMSLAIRLMRRRLGALACGAASLRSDRRALVAVLFLMIVWFAGFGSVLADETGGRVEQLDIVTSSGAHPFSVEVMRTEGERERGLMFRRALPADSGMLFDFETERLVQMWMKNTYLPLDMIFISRAGKVVGLAENTEPLSERIISSGAPAAGVLEVNAGAASRIGLKIGDRVRHPLFSK
jgi:uncharacterized membrane protein (UPF0127 family)